MTEGLDLALLGGLLIAGYVAHVAGRRAHIPRVTLLLLLGALAGPHALGVIPEQALEWVEPVTVVALAFVGFLLGSEVGSNTLERAQLWTLVRVVTALVLTSLVAVGGAVWLAGTTLGGALLLGAIAVATDAAATLDVIREAKAKGPLTDLILEIIALDDIVGVVVFSVALAGVEALTGPGESLAPLLHGLWDIGGAALLGVGLGLPMAQISGRLQDDDPTMAEAAGFVLLCAGLAALIEVSQLLACMTLGAVVSRSSTHGRRAFHEIEHVSEPFLIVFFVLAGLHLDVSALASLGLVGAAYVGSRIGARLLAGLAAGGAVGRELGLALLPQAGVALGLALLASHQVPEVAGGLLPLVVASTAVFEVIGPVLTKRALHRAGESS